LPFTTIMYVLMAPGGITGIWEWLFLILAVVLDVAGHGIGGWGNRDRIPGTA
jgi:hypothetical protein